ncbi:hypothetical protein BC937DRAFT_90447, partial [Endogone sp. FLAS-F59071]
MTECLRLTKERRGGFLHASSWVIGYRCGNGSARRGEVYRKKLIKSDPDAAAISACRSKELLL